MDSMRSLNTSLPGTSPPKQQAAEPPEQLLQAFKAAALSVTKLYKTAALDQTRARSEGYQDALDDLLSFLDKEDIGLSDGEGWRIRRWATERLDGRDAVNMESDDEPEKIERGSSPVLHRRQSNTQLSTRASSRSPTRAESTTSANLPTITEQPPLMLPPSGTFTFRSPHAYPQDSDMNSSDQEGPESALESSVITHNPHTSSPSITVTRPNRSSTRHNNTSSRHTTRGSGMIGRGAGQKRKINYGEFFDISNFGHGKDNFGGGGGGKRSRFA